VLELERVLHRVRRSRAPRQPHCGDACVFIKVAGQHHKSGPPLREAKPTAGQGSKAHSFWVIP
jgi:hypothetical protein